LRVTWLFRLAELRVFFIYSFFQVISKYYSYFLLKVCTTKSIYTVLEPRSLLVFTELNEVVVKVSGNLFRYFALEVENLQLWVSSASSILHFSIRARARQVPPAAQPRYLQRVPAGNHSRKERAVQHSQLVPCQIPIRLCFPFLWNSK